MAYVILDKLEGYTTQKRIKTWVKKTKLEKTSKKLSKKLKEIKDEYKKLKTRCRELAEFLGKEKSTYNVKNLSFLSKTVEEL